MKSFACICLLLIISYTSIYSQSLTLKHRKKDKTKTIAFNQALIFQTADTTLKHHRIIRLDKNFMIVAGLRDTIKIEFDKLIGIKKYNFKKRGIIEPFVYIGLLSSAGLIVYPIVTGIESGGEDTVEVISVMAVTTAVSGSVLLIALSKQKFDLKTKWMIVSP